MRVKQYYPLLIIFSLLYPFLSLTIAQDSLYLVGTITGESYEKRITDVKGVGDVNGDGYEDFMITYRDNIMKLFLGSSTLDLLPDLTFHPPGNDTMTFIGIAAGIGDVNGDGYNDFAIAGSFIDWIFPKGKVFLYLGGETIDTIPITEFYETWIQDWFGRVVMNIGDINKDGYNDFIITSPYNWSNGKGYAYLFWGGDTISWDRSITFTSSTLEDFFGESVANIGDINNDGYYDIAIGAAGGPSADTPKVYIYYGGITIDTIPRHALIGGGVVNIGDLNGDGKTNFIILNEQGINIYFSLDSILTFRKIMYNISSGDINQDGYNDFAIGDITYKNANDLMVGGVFVYLGREDFDTTYVYKLEGETKWSHFGGLSFCDINGDGFDDLLVTADGWPDHENPFGKVYFYSYIKIVDVEENEESILNSFELYQNYPNPFNPSTTISYALPFNSSIELTIYDIMGSKVKSFVIPSQSAGFQNIVWDGRNENGNLVSSGVYLYRIEAKSLENSEVFMKTAKLMLLK
jgi:hypothetical protein